MRHRKAVPRPCCLAVAAAFAVIVASDASASERIHQLVSPVDKNGVDVQNVLKVSPDGQGIAWVSLGAYAGAVGANAEVPYVARREGDTWTTRAAFPRDGGVFRPGQLSYFGAWAFADDLATYVAITAGSLDPADDDMTEFAPGLSFPAQDVYRVRADRTSDWISHNVEGPPTNEFIAASVSGLSADAGAVFFRSAEALAAEAATAPGVEHLYRWRGGAVELVGRDEHGALLRGGSVLGSNGTLSFASTGSAGDLPDSQAVSSDGSSFVFGGSDTPVAPLQVYLNTADGSVRRISSSQRSGSAGQPSASNATFVAAIGDLSTIYLRSADQLTDDAPVGGGDYRYDVATGQLSFSNVDDRLRPFGAPIGGFIRASQDGRHVYFASDEALAPGATPGQPNLYVKAPDAVRFISALDVRDDRISIFPGSGPASGAPMTLTGLSGDGSKFVYQTFASATDRDTSGFSQVYVYDATADTTRCVSCRSDVSPTSGNATIAPGSDYNIATPRVITDDGRRIAFVSAEPLVPQDVNGVADVYEYADGAARLISSGRSTEGSALVGITRDGSDVFFTTRSSLVPRDADGLVDVYAARLGGRPEQAPQRTDCHGDGCQPPPSGAPPSFPRIGSVGFHGTDAAPNRPAAVFSVGPLGPKRLARWAKSGRVTLDVDVSQGGTVRAVATTPRGRRRVRVASASASSREGGTLQLRLALSRSARAQLRRQGRLPVRITVTYSRSRRAQIVSVVLVKARSRPGRSDNGGKR